MKKHFIFLAFLFLQCTYASNDNNSIEKYFDNSIKVDPMNVPIDSNQGYFPFEIFKDTSIFVGRDTFLVDWYSKHLRAMKEPLLFNKKQNKSIFRFLWLRTFDNPIAITIEKQKDKYTLTWKLCDGAGGYDPGNLKIYETIQIDKESWEKFQTLLNKADYWNLATNEIMNGLNGSEWILEGVDGNKYHVVERWTPQSGNFYECCDFLIGLTDLEIKKRDKY